MLNVTSDRVGWLRVARTGIPVHNVISLFGTLLALIMIGYDDLT